MKKHGLDDQRTDRQKFERGTFEGANLNVRNKEKQNKRRRNSRTKWLLIAMIVMVFVLMLYIITTLVSLIMKTIEYDQTDMHHQVIQESTTNPDADISQENEVETIRDKTMKTLKQFAEENHFSVEEYPIELIELLEKNPETESFVLEYPIKAGMYDGESLEEYLHDVQIPLFLQWDSRWGYFEYGNKPMGLTGCGPTCLSMVALHLLQDPQMTPVFVADFAQRNGFYVNGTGTSWSLMTEGAAELGLYAREVSLDEDLVMRYLAQGKPIICAMGRGDFTETGHFIVFVGVENGKIRVNDPNSKARSEKLWNFEDIKYQIKNMWVYAVQ